MGHNSRSSNSRCEDLLRSFQIQNPTIILFYSKLTILSYKVRLNLTGPITCFKDLGIATGTDFHFPLSPRVGGRVPNVSLHATAV